MNPIEHPVNLISNEFVIGSIKAFIRQDNNISLPFVVNSNRQWHAVTCLQLLVVSKRLFGSHCFVVSLFCLHFQLAAH